MIIFYIRHQSISCINLINRVKTKKLCTKDGLPLLSQLKRSQIIEKNQFSPRLQEKLTIYC